jgi:predicted AAA+ superfamily ATPase
MGYVKTSEGHEVDFLVTGFDGSRQLIQVAADLTSSKTYEREIRALVEASKQFKNATTLLLCENPPPSGTTVPKSITILPVWQWLTSTQAI